MRSAFVNMQVHRVEHDQVSPLRKEPPAPAPSPAFPAPPNDEFRSTLEASPTIDSRKRKGVFVDAVEVPSLQHILRDWRRTSLTARPASYARSAPEPQLRDERRDEEPEPEPTLRRTRSATKLLGEQADFQRLPYTPKRRKMARAKQLRDEAAQMSSPSSPLRALRDAPLFGSGKCSIRILSQTVWFADRRDLSRRRFDHGGVAPCCAGLAALG